MLPTNQTSSRIFRTHIVTQCTLLSTQLPITMTKVSLADQRNEAGKPAGREYREAATQKARHASKEPRQ